MPENGCHEFVGGLVLVCLIRYEAVVILGIFVKIVCGGFALIGQLQKRDWGFYTSLSPEWKSAGVVAVFLRVCAVCLCACARPVVGQCSVKL